MPLALPRSPVSPVELEHEARDDHATRDLEGHPPDDVHLVPSVRVESRVVQLLSIEKLLHLGAWGHSPHPVTQRQQAAVTSQPPALSHPTLGSPTSLRSLPIPSSSISTCPLGHPPMPPWPVPQPLTCSAPPSLWPSPAPALVPGLCGGP